MDFSIGNIVSLATGGLLGSSDDGGQLPSLESVASTAIELRDSFASGDWQQGLAKIQELNATPQGQAIIEDLVELPCLDPVTRQALQHAQQQGYAPSPRQAAASYDAQWAAAVGATGRYFDLLDTATGVGGKDGIVGRCDLEAALKNPGLPKELRDACRFLLANPAAFNQLETAAGVGECDGFIGRCDVDAARAALPPPASTTAPGEVATEDDPGVDDDLELEEDLDLDGPDGEAVAEEECVADADADAGDDESWWPSGRTRFEGLSAEEIVEKVLAEAMASVDDQVVSLASEIAAKQDSLEGVKSVSQRNAINRSIEEMTREMQKLMSRRNEMYTLLSNYMSINHEMAKTAIQNMGRI